MDRRNVLKAAGLLAVGAGTLAGIPGSALAAERPPIRRPTRIFAWDMVGGFVPASWNLLRAPRLVVYPDRTAIADATHVVTLYATVVEELRMRAITVLSDPRNLRRRPGTPVIADAPSTHFEARETRGINPQHVEATIEALAEYREQQAYPRPLYRLLDDADAVRGRTVATGKPYRPDAVRLVVMKLEKPEGPVRSWPRGVPVPRLDLNGWVGHADLHGEPARQVADSVPGPLADRWTQFRTPDGTYLSTSWRHLLPDE
jgi:hypothetical protein